MTSALDCIYYCIFENNNFCPTIDGSSGLCCLDGKDCERNEFCSYDAPIASTSLQYFSCPMKRESCGMDFIHVPDVDGTVETIRPTNNFEDVFKGGEICKYRILFPAKAEDFDKIKLKVQRSSKVRIYAVETASYFNETV